MIDPCNLFIPRGYRGYDRMLEAYKTKDLARGAHRMAKHYDRDPNLIDQEDFFRFDQTHDGIHVNYNDFLEIVGRIADRK